MKARTWIAAAAVVLASAVALAQRVAETVQVTVVEVPVTVAGSDGKAMRGLTKDQFELYDEGKRVPVEYFEVLDMKVLDTSNKPLPPAATRNFLLFFDLANSSPGSIQRAGDAALSFIDAQMTARDLGAVATFTAEKGARLITSFTTDKEMLKAAVRTLGNPEYFKVADPLMVSFKTTALPSEMPVAAEREPGEAPSMEDRPKGASAQKAEANALFNEHFDTIEREQQRTATVAQNTEQRNRLKVQLSELSTIARVLDRLHGRKQIILLSEGFDARLVQGREDISAAKATEENDQKLSGEVWHVNSDERYGNAGASRDISEMATLFRRSDVVLHAIDIKGLRGNTDIGAGAVGAHGKSNEGLFLLTEPTGGTVFQHTNDLKATFARMMEQQEVVYLLGFNAKTAGKPGKFHALKVKTTAPGARVSHRAGYFEASDKMTNLEKTISLTEILMTDKPINDVGMSLSYTTLPGQFVEKARVPLVIELPGDKFLEGVDGGVLTANLFIYAFDKKNQVRDNLAQRIALDIIDEVETVRAGGIRYFGTLQLPPGDYAVKAVVRVEETGKVGFVRSDVHVPEFESAAVLPPVFLADSANWVTLAGSPRGDVYPYPFNAGEQKYVPRSHPALKQGASQRLALFLYRVSADSLAVSPQLVSAGGSAQTANVKLVGRTPADEQGASKLLFDFTPEKLAPGDYELRFTVRPKEGNETVVTLPFRII